MESGMYFFENLFLNIYLCWFQVQVLEKSLDLSTVLFKKWGDWDLSWPTWLRAWYLLPFARAWIVCLYRRTTAELVWCRVVFWLPPPPLKSSKCQPISKFWYFFDGINYVIRHLEVLTTGRISRISTTAERGMCIWLQPTVIFNRHILRFPILC